MTTRLNGLVYKNTRFDGLQRFVNNQTQRFVIDKSTAFQTIYPIRKYHQTINIGQTINKCQTIVSPNHVYPYRGYRGLLSKYRPTPGVSHTETLTVSHNGQGGIRRGYIEDTKPSLLIYTNHSMGHMRLYGLMV